MAAKKIYVPRSFKIDHKVPRQELEIDHIEYETEKAILYVLKNGYKTWIPKKCIIKGD